MDRSFAAVSASLLVAVVACGASLHAQVAFRAVTRTGLFVRAAGSGQSLPANTDISSGRTVAAMWSGADGSASARTQFGVARSDRALVVTLDESGSATWNPQSLGFFFPHAQVGDPAAMPPTHSIDVQLSSPVPMSVRVEVTMCADWDGHYSGTLAIPGHGALKNQRLLTAPCWGPPSQVAFDLTLGPTPTVLVFTTEGRCQASRINSSPSFHGRWTLTITNSSPCAGLAYETPCGATLASYGTLNQPGTWLELVDSASPSAALLLVGTQRQRIPVASCFVYTDFPIILPFALTSTHGAVVYVPPPPFAAMVTTQSLTVGPTGFHASNGLELRCR